MDDKEYTLGVDYTDLNEILPKDVSTINLIEDLPPRLSTKPFDYKVDTKLASNIHYKYKFPVSSHVMSPHS